MMPVGRKAKARSYFIRLQEGDAKNRYGRNGRYGRLVATLFTTSAVLAVAFLSGCGGSISVPAVPGHEFPAGFSIVPLATADHASSNLCKVSVDGFIWYSLPSGSLPPIDFTQVRCSAAASIDASALPAAPSWARPNGATQAIFVATSLQESYSLPGMRAVENVATGAGLPVTWMIGDATYLKQDAAYYNQVHAANGDDVELENNSTLYELASRTLPWYTPAVSVEGAGHERRIGAALTLGNSAFWGITWNSHGTDNTSDEGSPWGAYCADPNSYKRPSPGGDCRLLSFEWTARDLTRAYFANTLSAGYSAEAAFSTDPDDILLRAGFATADGAAYEAALVDAYAAAGVSAPLVMMSQQESAEQAARGTPDDVVLSALYAEAKRVGMRTMTLRQAAVAARAFAARPRAIAFPYIAGGNATGRNGASFSPATIDYHDNAAGMTFVSGHTLPDRLFEYAQDPVSTFNRTLVATNPGDPAYPRLRKVAFSNGRLSFAFDAPSALRFGVAVWSDPSVLGISGPNIVPAGHAGFVASFDLPAGTSVQSIPCGQCSSTTFAFSH